MKPQRDQDRPSLVHTERMTRGRLRVYLGAAAGAGTTYSMLAEGRRRSERGTRVVVGCVDTRGRPRTIDALRGLTDDPSTAPADLDVDACVAAAPHVVLVDELASVQPDGRPRWHDVERLLEAGIDVISTLSVQHIASLADPVRSIIGHAPANAVPDEWLDRADQIELVDITPEAIRRRIAHGNVFTADALTPADAELYGSDAFSALRALLMSWMADRLTSGPDDHRDVREVVVVAITDSPSSDAVLRRAAHMARRARARLVAVHVTSSRQASEVERRRRRERVETYGGVVHELMADDPADAVVSFAVAEGATQLVLGAPTTRRPSPVIIEALRSGAVEVHLVPAATADLRPGPRRRVPRPGVIASVLLGVLAVVALTAVLVAVRDEFAVGASLALFLLLVVIITALGGAVAGVTAAVASPLAANWFLIPPYDTFRVADPDNLIELFSFVSIATIVAFFVSVSARRAAEAGRARDEAAVLAALAGSADLDQPRALVDQVASTFGFDGAAVLAVAAEGRGWDVLAATGDAPVTPADAAVVSPISPDVVLAARGAPLTPDDHRVLRAFTAQLARSFEQIRLRGIAADADVLAKADELRTAILRAVSHDLRSPLAAIKASVSSLRQSDVDWPDDVRDDFLESIESETDRLTAIITNLLDLSRIEAGVLRPVMRPVGLDDVVSSSLRGLPAADVERITVDLTGGAPVLTTDPALLERVLANLVTNALRFSPADGTVRVVAHVFDTFVQIHVIDRGPGIPSAQRPVVTQPFHRLEDSMASGGLGLGLAIVDRIVAALGGSLDLRDTPGGGLTAVVEVPVEPA